MTGTEKQIAWAENIVSMFERVMNAFEKENSNNPQIDKLHEMHITIIENMRNSNAGTIIDDFKHYEMVISDDAETINENYRKMTTEVMVAAKADKHDYRLGAQQ